MITISVTYLANKLARFAKEVFKTWREVQRLRRKHPGGNGE